MKTRLILVVLVLALATVVTETWARKRARPMPREEVAQTWVGVSADEQYMLRLILSEDGTGSGGYIFLDEEPRTFRIPAWHYESGEINIEAVPPPGEPSWVRPMKGSVVGATMRLHAQGDDWKVDLALRRETELQQRWTRLQRTMTGQLEE